LPEGGLVLNDVGGEVSAAHGVLTGEQLAGHFRNRQARDGVMRVGLTNDLYELSVTAAVQADASGLPALLRQAVDSETLKRDRRARGATTNAEVLEIARA